MPARGPNIPAAAATAILAAVLALAVASASPAGAAIIIHVGQVDLLADTPGQTVQIRVSSDSGDRVAGCNFNAEIASGGPDFAEPDGPDITAVDLITGTIFESNNHGQHDLGSLSQLAMLTVVTQAGDVEADGLLATLTIDTTGFTDIGQSWTLSLSDTHNGPTDFAPSPAVIIDGTIRIVPEPATLSLVAVVGLALLIRRRRIR